ncbi:hypothetical protein VTI28DRAFT_3961 [Corynascus sepedonium]
MTDPGKQGQHQASRVGRSWFASRTGNGILRAENAPPSRMRGVRAEGLVVCETSRMGGAFRPPSPAPFAVVTEPAPLWEREPVLGRQNFGRGVGSCLLSQLQLCEGRDLHPPVPRTLEKQTLRLLKPANQMRGPMAQWQRVTFRSLNTKSCSSHCW